MAKLTKREAEKLYKSLESSLLLAKADMIELCKGFKEIWRKKGKEHAPKWVEDICKKIDDVLEKFDNFEEEEEG